MGEWCQIWRGWERLAEVVVGTEDVDNLVHVHLLHVLASGLEILTRIEVTGVLVEVLADGGGHGETAVGVDVDLADCALGGFTELLLGDTYGIGEFATVGVDGVNLVLGDAAGTVEYDGEAGELLFDLVQDVESEGRRNELAGLRVAGALFGSELVSAVAGTDGDGEAVATAAGAEIDYLFGLGVVAYLGGYLILYAGENTEFGFYGNIVSVSVFYDLLGEGDVLLVGEAAAVDHYAGETVVDAVLAEFEGVTVVEVENDFRSLATEFLGILYSTLGHVAEDGAVGIVTGALADLHDDGALGFYGSLHDGLHLLEGVEVESGDGIATCYGLLEHLAGVHETEFFVTGHGVKLKVKN